MHLQAYRIQNYRRLKNVCIELEPTNSIFVGANNSGKTSATHIFLAFLGDKRTKLSINDFSSDCWQVFNEIGEGSRIDSLPTITLDLWFTITDADLHRVTPLLPDLEWQSVPVGVRLEFAPENESKVVEDYRAARAAGTKQLKDTEGVFTLWPRSLKDFLDKNLSAYYKTYFYVLDPAHFDSEFNQKGNYEPLPLGDTRESGKEILSSLVKVDFLSAQRFLSDSETRGRSENLSNRLNRFYVRNLKKRSDDYEALKAISKSEEELNKHLAIVFQPLIDRLENLGYPGFADPELKVLSSLDAESILTQNASIHYELKDPETPDVKAISTLPDKYNGLGYKNMIYMLVEILDFHLNWANQEHQRPPLHIVIIEEPEAHLHAQLQQVFVSQLRETIPPPEDGFETQFLITTHSAHITYGSNFLPIRYFRRAGFKNGGNFSEVLSLCNFDKKNTESAKFLHKYMKLTHCDLFFADAAILVEGNVEKLLLPLMIDKAAPDLKTCYLSVIELGGAFAHKFQDLIHFLGITTLIITDLDSIYEDLVVDKDHDDDDEDQDIYDDEGEDAKNTPTGSKRKKACLAEQAGATTSNQTLIKWLPQLNSIADLTKDTACKEHKPSDSAPAKVRVAYQKYQKVNWKSESKEILGRTFEEAFAFENLVWCQSKETKELSLNFGKAAASLDLEKLKLRIHNRVKGKHFDKTKFAIWLMLQDEKAWEVPNYISEGLQWLNNQMPVITKKRAKKSKEPQRDKTSI